MAKQNLKKSKALKRRNWTFIAYPESVPDNWLEILRKTGVATAISPLHEPEETESGEEIKPHWHVILAWENGTVRQTQAEKVAKSVNGTYPQPVESIRGLYDYLTHKNSPEKKQYSESEIKLLNGFSIRDFAPLKGSELFEKKMQIHEIVERLNLKTFGQLLNVLKDLDKMDLCEVATINTTYCSHLLHGKRLEAEFKEKDKNGKS